MAADILNIVNLGSVSTNTNGSSVDISRIARTSVFVNVTAGSFATINIESSPTGDFSGEEQSLDSKTYSSGTSLQADVFSYNSNFPFMRTTLTASSGTTVSTTITGRGV